MALEITFAVLLFIGIFITAIPTLPGMLYMLMIVSIYGVVDGFQHFSPWFLALFGGLVLLAMISDYASGLLGARFGGANKTSILFGLIGMVVGFIFFPPLGFLPGLFLGVFVAELVQFEDHKKALKAASYSFVATVAGMLFNVALAIAFFVAFLILIF